MAPGSVRHAGRSGVHFCDMRLKGVLAICDKVAVAAREALERPAAAALDSINVMADP